MLCAARVRLCLGLLLLAAASSAVSRQPGDLEEKKAAPPGLLRTGLTPDEVKNLLGPPSGVARQVVAHRALEQWLYGPPHQLRLVFDCPRGRKPRLVRFRPLPPHAP
jgi:hypothetical protein